jgi:NADPH:quinone reductase
LEGVAVRAAYYEKNGPAADVLRVGDVVTPKPGPGEVRVKLACSGVNPSDVKSREGRTRKIAFPQVIPHSDGAGVIDVVGDGVPAERIGERVWVWNGQWKRAFGTAAEFITLPAHQAVPLPKTASFEVGACLGIPAMTAFHAVSLAGTWAGCTLLIAGGAGAVANYAIQFAKARGAAVITTVSSEDKAKHAHAAGADHCIDYRREDVGARVRDLTDSEGVDAVIELDFAANAKLTPGVLRPNGSVIVYGTGSPEATIPAQWMLTNGIAIEFMLVYELTPEERQAAVAGITEILTRDRLVHSIAATFPLDDIVAAHQAVESGKVTGNVVVRLGEPA